jgi:hypothetical protein
MERQERRKKKKEAGERRGKGKGKGKGGRTELVKDGLSLASEGTDDALDDLDETHLYSRSHLDQPDGSMGSLPVRHATSVSRTSGSSVRGR